MSRLTLWIRMIGLLAGLALAMPGSAAAENPLAPGWTLDEGASTLSFQSIKNGSVIETSTFSSFQGTIAPDGTAGLTVQLDSVDTGVDLRNVRMRFLFFETFKFPEVQIQTLLDPSALRELAEKRRVRMVLPFTMSLHGAEQTLEAETAVTLITEDLVSVATVRPIQFKVEPFGLLDGVRKLEEAASVTIVPSTSVTFDLLFTRDAAAAGADTASAQPATPAPAPAAAPAVPAATANETRGAFSRAECVGRLEILSQTGSIYFRSGSAELDPESAPLLATLIDIAQRCPQINFVIEGHTDSQGGADLNQKLSEARAGSVLAYLVGKGVAPDRLAARGYGELRPIAPNDTKEGRARNRRIAFTPAPE